MSFEELMYSLFIYGGTFAISCAFVYVANNSRNFKGLLSLIGVCIPAITATFRESGIDYKAYESIYINIQRGTGYEDIEAFWYYLNKIMPSFKMLLFVSALIFVAMAYFAICQFMKTNRTFAWFIFLTVCYSTFYNGMRQMIAVSIFFAAAALLYKKKYFMSLLFVVGAFFFHETIAFMIIVPLYMFLCKKVKHSELVAGGLTAIFVLGIPVITKIIEMVGLYSSYVEDTSWNLSVGFLLYAIPPLIPFWYFKRRVNGNRLVALCYDLYLLVIPFQFLGMSIHYADRMMLYVQIFVAVLIPSFVQELRRHIGRNDWKLIYVLWFIFHYLILNAVMNGNETFPYMIFSV